MKKINVTQSFLPPINQYINYISKIWENKHLTNQGPLLRELQQNLSDYLEVSNLHVISNGTIALQLALHALDITEGEIITTPFSYVATTSSILWERCEPVFVDIEPNTFCIDADKIEVAITKETKAIMAVHVFGIPCDVEKIQKIADKHNLKIIYDAAHAFGVKYQGKSILEYGDVSTCSFHATKLFQTVEGGCVVARDKQISDKIELAKKFGHEGDNHISLGINAKMSEFHAAMGLCNLPEIGNIIAARKEVCELYDELLRQKINISPKCQYNYAYYPYLLKDEATTLAVINALNAENISPRRYFYPSLNTLPYLKKHKACPISQDISKRILCLPLYVGLEAADVHKICKIIKGFC